MDSESNQNVAAFYTPETLTRLAKASRSELERAAKLGLVRYTILPRGRCQAADLEGDK